MFADLYALFEILEFLIQINSKSEFVSVAQWIEHSPPKRKVTYHQTGGKNRKIEYLSP